MDIKRKTVIMYPDNYIPYKMCCARLFLFFLLISEFY